MRPKGLRLRDEGINCWLNVRKYDEWHGKERALGFTVTGSRAGLRCCVPEKVGLALDRGNQGRLKIGTDLHLLRAFATTQESRLAPLQSDRLLNVLVKPLCAVRG